MPSFRPIAIAQTSSKLNVMLSANTCAVRRDSMKARGQIQWRVVASDQEGNSPLRILPVRRGGEELRYAINATGRQYRVNREPSHSNSLTGERGVERGGGGGARLPSRLSCALLLMSGIGLSLRKGKDPFAPHRLHDARAHQKSVRRPV